LPGYEKPARGTFGKAALSSARRGERSSRHSDSRRVRTPRPTLTLKFLRSNELQHYRDELADFARFRTSASSDRVMPVSLCSGPRVFSRIVSVA
jgi:hypothetical protein